MTTTAAPPPPDVGTDPLGRVWTATHATRGELAALVAEGLLVPALPGVWLPADLARCRTARAAAVAALLRAAGVGTTTTGRPAVVAGAAAAWVHGCARAPRRVDVLVVRGTGARDVGPHVRLQRVADPVADAVLVGTADGPPLVLTGRRRTAEELRAAGAGRVCADVRAWLVAEGALPPLPRQPSVEPAGCSARPPAR